MKLVTKAIEAEFKRHPLYSQDGKGKNAIAIVRYFLPVGAWTWFVTEAERQPDGDWLFFGLVINGYGETEFGYFTLSQLQEIKACGGLIGVERDILFDPAPLSECI